MGLDKHRRSKKSRLIIMVVLLAILGVLFFVYEKFRIWIIGIMIVLLGAIGLEMSGTDFDVQKLVETGSFAESKIEQTSTGTWLIGDDCAKEKFNCSNFGTQSEAQELFEKCGGLENDAHGLDRDKDGKVCEALPIGERTTSEAVEETTEDISDAVGDLLQGATN